MRSTSSIDCLGLRKRSCARWAAKQTRMSLIDPLGTVAAAPDFASCRARCTPWLSVAPRPYVGFLFRCYSDPLSNSLYFGGHGCPGTERHGCPGGETLEATVGGNYASPASRPAVRCVSHGRLLQPLPRLSLTNWRFFLLACRCLFSFPSRN